MATSRTPPNRGVRRGTRFSTRRSGCSPKAGSTSSPTGRSASGRARQHRGGRPPLRHHGRSGSGDHAQAHGTDGADVGAHGDGASGCTDLRDWAACLVRPRRTPVGTGQPDLVRAVLRAGDQRSRAVRSHDRHRVRAHLVHRLLARLNRCPPGPPADVHVERSIMASRLVTQMCVERERALADGTPTLRPSWDGLAERLVDAITGLWPARVTRHS